MRRAPARRRDRGGAAPDAQPGVRRAGAPRAVRLGDRAEALIGGVERPASGASPRSPSQHRPEGDRDQEEHNEQSMLEVARLPPQRFDVIAESIPDAVPGARYEGDIHDGPEQVGDEEAPRPEAGGAREGAGHEPEPRDESRDEHRQHAVAPHEGLDSGLRFMAGP